jgi:hypothetical protein
LPYSNPGVKSSTRNQVRSLVCEIRSALDAVDSCVSERKDLEAWLAWADDYVADLDPVAASLDELLRQ